MAMGTWAALAGVVVIAGGALVGVTAFIEGQRKADQEQQFARCDAFAMGREQASASEKELAISVCKEEGWNSPVSTDGDDVR